jgi:hypothetical protein
MGGGLMQLVAYGAQDIYLTGQPQITFFKAVYRRYTNFAMESILQTINGSVNPGSTTSVTIARNGDLLKNLWLEFNPSEVIPSGTTGVTEIGCDFGHAIIDTLELEIGGQLIDRQYGRWLTIWRDLTELNPTGCQGNLNSLNGDEPILNSTYSYQQAPLSTKYQFMSYTHQGTFAGNPTRTYLAPVRAYIPLQFWFCKNPGLALPLIALQYHEVKLNIKFASIASFIAGTPSTTPNLSSVKIYADYIYLDTTERRQFAQNAHEYLIDQLQYQELPATNGNIQTFELNFNHPVKELIWTGKPVNVVVNSSANSGGNITGAATPSSIVANATGTTITTPNVAPTSDCSFKIVLNGTDRFTSRHITYFTRNQIWDYHTGFGSTASNYNFNYNRDAIAVYSFALRPEEHQPSGTCNFSRIDTAQLVSSGTTPLNALDVYAVNYNVLRIMSGMGGLAYSN